MNKEARHPGAGRGRARATPKGMQVDPEVRRQVAALLGEAPRRRDLLIEYLKAHGVSARPLRWPNTGELSAVDAMFASLDSEEADLIVAGAYGHSRWIEGLFGGASRDLVRQHLLPVFMSH